MILLGLLGVGMTALCLWALLNAKNDLKVWLAGLVGVPFFGLAAVLIFRRAFEPGVVVRVDERGVYWRSWSPDPIPFDAIIGAEVRTYEKQRFLTLRLRDPQRHPPQTRTGRLMAGANRRMGFGDVAIGTSGLDRSFDDFVAAFEDWFSAAGPHRAGG
jgi:hypothetical protein